MRFHAAIHSERSVLSGRWSDPSRSTNQAGKAHGPPSRSSNPVKSSEIFLCGKVGFLEKLGEALKALTSEGRHVCYLYPPTLVRSPPDTRIQVCVIGDMNICREDIDVALLEVCCARRTRYEARPTRLGRIHLRGGQANLDSSCFVPEERALLTHILTENHLVDVFRHLHPEIPGYTWFDPHTHMGRSLVRKRCAKGI